jgi:hypothetical protein
MPEEPNFAKMVESVKKMGDLGALSSLEDMLDQQYPNKEDPAYLSMKGHTAEVRKELVQRVHGEGVPRSATTVETPRLPIQQSTGDTDFERFQWLVMLAIQEDGPGQLKTVLNLAAKQFPNDARVDVLLRDTLLFVQKSFPDNAQLADALKNCIAARENVVE